LRAAVFFCFDDANWKRFDIVARKVKALFVRAGYAACQTGHEATQNNGEHLLFVWLLV
jgi:hypothetical protein